MDDEEGIHRSNIIFVLNEIGRMELHSNLFEGNLRSMLKQNVRLVGRL
jgi:nucleoside-triphosphatase THEP1